MLEPFVLLAGPAELVLGFPESKAGRRTRGSLQPPQSLSGRSQNRANDRTGATKEDSPITEPDQSLIRL